MNRNKIFKYVFYNQLRSKLVIGYGLLFVVICFGLFYLNQDNSKALLSILNICLLIVPLVSIILSTINYYNSREFIELLVSQPINRNTIFRGIYLGQSLALGLTFLIGISIPIIIWQSIEQAIFLLLSGFLLTFIFSSIGLLIGVVVQDKAKGIGLAVLHWFYFSVVFDGFILGILYLFQDYPIDKAIIALTWLNPIDTARVINLLQFDISALMGFTGALLKNYLGSSFGLIISNIIMTLWAIIPFLIGEYLFKKKNF